MAGEMRTVNMGAVAAAVGVAFPLAITPALDYIRDTICRQRGLPWLPAIVVNAGTWRPRGGFIPNNMVIDDDDFERWWRGMVLQVFAYNWDEVDI